ncbi:hypothetical protein LXA43DRAFT_1047332 [Ganoderma leucocontextum]|nr:hypothetical protein LXA43DRAFT_1047332 [Ganoderma leucocontextum]
MAILKDLPPELFHEIFAAMQDDSERPLATLIACSVVSRLWRDIALPQLFSTFRTRRTESFTDVVRFLSTHAHIAACVKRLYLQRTGLVFPNPELKLHLKPEIDHHTVHALLEHLPALHTLCFLGVKFVDAHVVPSGSQFASSASPPVATTNTDALPDDLIRPHHLQWVTLQCCTVPRDPTPLFRILSLGDIGTFQVIHTEFPDEPLEPAALHRTLRMRKLELGLQSRWKLDRLLEAFQRRLEPGCVRELNVVCDNWTSIASAGALLRDVGRNLTVLKLRLSHPGADAVNDMKRWAALKLSSCTALETFHFLPSTFMMDGAGMSPGTAFTNIAGSLAPSVRTIVLGLDMFVDEARLKPAESLGLEKLDKAVMEGGQGRFPELARVTLQFASCKKDELEAWATISRRAMPRLERAGLLHVTCGDR